MLKELGEYKNRLASLFVNDGKLCRVLLGENYEEEVDDPDSELEKYVLPHLYVEPAVTEEKSYVFFDLSVPKSGGTIKTLKIEIQAICHKRITAYPEKPEGYSGLRYDVLAQYIEELLCPAEKELRRRNIRRFGIGCPELAGVELFLTDTFVGRTLIFTAPDFK